MFIRKVTSNMQRLTPIVRALSSQGSLIDLKIDDDGVSIMTLQRPPVNSLNLDILKELSKSLDEVAKNKSKGLILTSALSTVFSAGLDIMEIYKPDLKRAEEFWSTLQDVWIKLFGFEYPTAAAINGHSSAGGCLLAMSCEYRVQVQGKYRIGLNETALGIVAPRWVMDTMLNTISVREAELAFTTARLFTVDEALKVGLIDETATDKEDAVNKCKGFIMKFNNISLEARTITKLKLRGGALSKLKDNRKADIKEFLGNIQNHRMQKNIEVYIHALKKKAAN